MSHMNNPPHPGAIIAEELEALGISAREFARHIGVAPSSVTRILNEEGPITPKMAVKIAQALQGPDADMWLRMQANYDAWQAKTSIDVSHISKILPKANPSPRREDDLRASSANLSPSLFDGYPTILKLS